MFVKCEGAYLTLLKTCVRNVVKRDECVIFDNIEDTCLTLMPRETINIKC